MGRIVTYSNEKPSSGVQYSGDYVTRDPVLPKLFTSKVIEEE